MSIFFFLDCSACIVESVHQFACQTFFHSAFTTKTSIIYNPTNTEGLTAISTNFNWHLIVRTTDTASTYFKYRHNIFQCLIKNFHWVLTHFGTNNFECIIYDSFSNAFFTIVHNFVNETCY